MNRRGFLGAIIAACAAPAIVRADSLMRIVPRDTTLLLPLEWDGFDWGAINRLKGEILAHALRDTLFGCSMYSVTMPKNVGDTITFRRVSPYRAG